MDSNASADVAAPARVPDVAAVSADPPSIAWASQFAETAPYLPVAVPGPKSRALYQRCNRYEFGELPWVESVPVGFAAGVGVTLEDVDGNRFIDVTHGHLGAGLGHANPEVNSAVAGQMDRLMHLRNQPTEVRAELMERMASITPGDLNLFAFYSSGTESAEGAMRVARAVTGGHEFVSIYGDYHGRTSGAIATSQSNRTTGPRPGGFVTVPGAYCARCEFKLEPSSCGFHCVGFAERAMQINSHGALAGIVVEPVTNASGARVYPPGYLTALRELADRNNILLIFDEHATGLGRTGTMWAGDREGVVPDVMFFGKYLGNGYPITVVATREKYRDALAHTSQSSTHGGQAAACAAALATIDIVLRDDLAGHAARSGDACLTFMKGVKARHPIVGAAQGLGYLLGFEFVDPQTGQPSQSIALKVYVACMKRGVSTSWVGPTIRVSPMMVTSQAIALKAMAIIEQAIGDVEAGL